MEYLHEQSWPDRQHTACLCRSQSGVGRPTSGAGVLARDGKVHQVHWLGFIERSEAKLTGGRPVKLVISRVGRIDLGEGQYVHGCLVESGVYAVTDSQVAIISI